MKSVRIHKSVAYTRFLLCVIFFTTSLILNTSCSTDDDFTIYTNISGVIIDSSDSSPISGASVTIIPTNRNTITDSSGRFTFSDLQTQQYTLSVQKDGYKPNRKTVDGVRGKTIDVTITLSKI